MPEGCLPVWSQPAEAHSFGEDLWCRTQQTVSSWSGAGISWRYTKRRNASYTGIESQWVPARDPHPTPPQKPSGGKLKSAPTLAL